MGKPGGFFKRLKAKEKTNRMKQKGKRGSKGVSKADRVLKHNALVEYYVAKRHLDDLDAISVSSSDHNNEDLAEEEARPIDKLRALLGTPATAATRSGGDIGKEKVVPGRHGSSNKQKQDPVSNDIDDDDDDGDEFEGPIGSDNDEEDEDVSGSDEGNDDADDADAAGGGMNMLQCGTCGADLQQSPGIACFSCKACFCPKCQSKHKDHDAVQLQDLDDDEEEEGEEGDEEGEEARFGADDDDDGDDVVEEPYDPELENDDFASLTKHAEDRRAFLQQHTFQGTDESVAAAAGLLPQDMWFARYAADSFGAPDTTRFTTIDATPASSSTPVESKKLSKQDHQEQHSAPSSSCIVAALLSSSNSGSPPVAVQATAKAAKHLQELETLIVAASSSSSSSPFSLVGTTKNNKKKRYTPLSGNSTSASAAAESEHSSSVPPLLHPFIAQRWKQYLANTPNLFTTAAAGEGTMTGIQSSAFDEGTFWSYVNLLSIYADVLHTSMTFQQEPLWLHSVCLHLLNHWAKTQAVRAVHDEQIRAKLAAKKQQKLNKKKGAAATSSLKKKRRKTEGDHDDDGDGDVHVANADDHDDFADDDEDASFELRDRGFGRTRILVILPMRNIALRYINTLLGIMGLKSEEGASRYSSFCRDFSELPDAVDPKFHKRPKEYQAQFEGNINDTFCFGVSFHPAAKRVALYTHPFNADMVFCSPLGLRQRLERDADILVSLSSIEVCVVDQADTLLMQNWDHTQHIFSLLNRKPVDTTEGLSDLRRVYPWALEGKAKQYRQTIVVSKISNALIHRTLMENCTPNGGRITLAESSISGVLGLVPRGLRQHFLRLTLPRGVNPTDADELRFKFFTSQVFPGKIKPAVERNVRIILFIPSFFDFSRVRAWLHEEIRGSFCELSEYSSPKEQRKALGQFTALERSLLLMSGRFYYFNRYFVKLAEQLFFYSPPPYGYYYSDMASKLVVNSPNVMLVSTFCHYDVHELVRIVGTRRAKQLLENPNSSFLFLSESN